MSKYYDEAVYTTLAVLDFGLTTEQVNQLLSEALELVADRTRYSLRELVGTMLALRHQKLRGRENLLARRRSLFCSAFVQHLYRKVGLDLAPGVDAKHTTPEDIARTPLPHVAYVLRREPSAGTLGELTDHMSRRVRVGLRQFKRRAAKVSGLPL